ncbi:UNVERIFIED_CONTAM: hypothetical protein PYX00_005115 [Menopon gallinae]|uniref:Rho-GAP domain-containing protein n=1 Tax=Menopon gallinae TaxID=328185 RepID=A0AAW2HPX4_9NEOP
MVNKLKRNSKNAYQTFMSNWDMGQCFSRKEKKEIISTRCLEAVKETMEILKDNLETEGLFISSGNIRTRRKIQSYISRGDIYTLRNWGFEFVVECAAALKMFLLSLPQPLIPKRVQKLVIAENTGVPEKTIANDALGLLKEEVSGRHKELLLEVFTFLKDAAVKENTSELTGCNLPLKLLPVFFDIETDDPQKFRDVATVFHEIIMEAPEHLRTPCAEIGSDEFKLLESILTQDLRVPNISFLSLRSERNQATGETPEWRYPLPRVPHTRLHPWLGRLE